MQILSSELHRISDIFRVVIKDLLERHLTCFIIHNWDSLHMLYISERKISQAGSSVRTVCSKARQCYTWLQACSWL